MWGSSTRSSRRRRGTRPSSPQPLSTVRAAAALNVSPVDIFVPMFPSIVVGLAVVVALAYFMGRSERRRLGSVDLVRTRAAATVGGGASDFGELPVHVDGPVPGHPGGVD